MEGKTRKKGKQLLNDLKHTGILELGRESASSHLVENSF